MLRRGDSPQSHDDDFWEALITDSGTAYIPLEDFDKVERAAKAAIEMGAKALMIPSWCPQNHSPSHIGLFLFGMGKRPTANTLPVGGEEKVNPATYKVNGLPAVPDFHGGDANFTSITYLPISTSVQQTLAAHLDGGSSDKFQAEMGAIELGASWFARG